MTAISIQAPFPTIPDIDGQPLEDGYIWIGVANLAPITNPITVYWDAALTLPAAQPVRTLGGYPMNSGTPGRLYAATDYSILVQNKTGSTVYSSADNNGPLFGGTISSVDVTFLQSGTGAVERTAQAKMRDIVTPEDFGAVGDGVNNDTVALQNALNTLKEVRGTAGKTYLVSRTGGARYCLLWKTGMRWVGCGSVIKLANSQYQATNGVSVIMSEGVDVSPATITQNTYFEGIVDGNSANQTAVSGSPSGGWFTPTVYVDKIANTQWDIIIRNGHVLAFYASGSAVQVYDNRLRVSVYGASGGGVNVYGTRWDIPHVYAVDTPYVNNSGSQGNPFVANITNSTIGRVYGENFGFGVKFQDGCENLTIDSIIAKQGAGTSPQKDRGVKFQGTALSPNRNITVGNIVVQGMQPGGLFIYECLRLTIGSYIGSGNGQNGALGENERVDTYIVDSDDVTINSLTVEGCGQYPLITQNDANNINIGTFTCANTPNNTSLIYPKGGSAGNLCRVNIGNLTARNETAGWASVLNIGSASTNLYIGSANIDVPFSNYTAAGRTIISQDASGGYVRTGPITFRNTPSSGVVQLTNNSTSTAVAAAAAMVATNGIDCAPIIKIEPVSYNNTNNSSGLKRGDFTVSVGNESTGGITIRHPSIDSAGAFYARWTIEGFQAPGDSLEATSTNSLRIETSFSAVDIANKNVNPNLGDKYAGRMVWDTTNNRMMRANGANPTDPWYVVDGSASVTPS